MRPATSRNEPHSRSTRLTAFYQIPLRRVLMDRNISRIQEHGLRSVWENEERDFTRWLTENIDLLASELGIEIEDARAEEAVGDFSADIVAREMNTGETVVIENQYNRTDHDHLGKLLTYSSGKNAGFTMWLAEEFRPEHRSVLEWLNESGPKGAKFFAIKPRVVSIEGPRSVASSSKSSLSPTNGNEKLVPSLFPTPSAAIVSSSPRWWRRTLRDVQTGTNSSRELGAI